MLHDAQQSSAPSELPHIAQLLSEPPYQHILPDFDDGARNWEESLEMARLTAGDGIGTIVATPHILHKESGQKQSGKKQLVMSDMVLYNT